MQDSIYVAELLQGHRQLSGFFIASGLETIIFTLSLHYPQKKKSDHNSPVGPDSILGTTDQGYT